MSDVTPLREITHILFHKYPAYTLDDLKRNHRKKGLVKNGYHYAVTPDGTIHVLRPEAWGGWFDKTFDDKAIGIALIGEMTTERARSRVDLTQLLQGKHTADLDLVFVDKERVLR